MQNESRINRGLLNMRVNLACYFLNIIVSFFTRKVFLDKLGTDFVGLTSTLQSLLGFLNIAELGVAASIAYFLYKPIYEGDKEKINEIISVFGYLYRIIGCVILSGGVIMSIFLPKIFEGTEFTCLTLYIGFYAYLFVAMLGYFVNYKQTLLTADQRNYIVTGLNQAIIAGKGIAQMILVYKYQDFFLFFLLEAVFGISYSIVLNRQVNKTYPWLESEIKSGRKLLSKYSEIKKKIGQVCVHKIGGFVQYQLMPMLIYGFVSLQVVALYTNYITLTNAFRSMLNSVLNSTTAGVGSLVAEGNKKRIFSIYNGIFVMNMLVSVLFSAFVYDVISDFVVLWLGENFVLDRVVVLLICVQLFLGTSRLCTEQFLGAYGLFSDIWAPLVEAILFVLCSIIFGTLWGLKGILLGPIISTLLVVHVWKPYFLFTRGLKLKVIRYYTFSIKTLLTMVTTVFLGSFITMRIMDMLSMPVSWLQLIIHAVIDLSIYSILGISAAILISREFREILFGIIGRIFKKHKK